MSGLLQGLGLCWKRLAPHKFEGHLCGVPLANIECEPEFALKIQEILVCNLDLLDWYYWYGCREGSTIAFLFVELLGWKYIDIAIFEVDVLASKDFYSPRFRRAYRPLSTFSLARAKNCYCYCQLNM